MTAEIVLQGIGVYTPEEHQLEGDAARLSHGIDTVEHSVDRLIVNIHDPLVVAETLAHDKVRDVREVTLNYISGYSFSMLKYALEDARLDSLRLLRVTGGGGCCPDHSSTLRMLYGCLAGARIELFDQVSGPSPCKKPDEVIRDDNGNWCRRMGDFYAMPARCYPFIDVDAKGMFIDCDASFHPTHLKSVLQRGLDNLILADVACEPTALFAFFTTPHPPLKTLAVGVDRQWVRALSRMLPYPVTGW